MNSLSKWYQKDPVWFSVGWIAVYVIGFGFTDSLSESLGTPKLLTVVMGLVLSYVLLGFIRRNSLNREMGLCKPHGSAAKYLYYAPLLVLVSVNFWQGMRFDTPLLETVLFIISMVWVAVLEEVIFRGLMFRSLLKINRLTAYLVSSLAFGAGHVINLLMGAPVMDTLLQLIYASAAGFCFTALSDASGSLIPCILAHALVNTLSVFAPEYTPQFHLLTAAVTTATSLLYGGWLLKNRTAFSLITREGNPS